MNTERSRRFPAAPPYGRKRTPGALRVRPMQPAEAEQVSAMIMDSFNRFVAADFDDFGKENFADFAAPENLRLRQHYGYLTLVAEAGGEVRGMIQIRPPSHLLMLFVQKEFQGLGLATALVSEAIERVRKDPRPADFMTVNSSPYAIGFYRRLGFEPVAPEAGGGGRPASMRLALTPAQDPEH